LIYEILLFFLYSSDSKNLLWHFSPETMPSVIQKPDVSSCIFSLEKFKIVSLHFYGNNSEILVYGVF